MHIYGVIVLSGKNKKQRKFIRRRDLIMSREKKPDKIDIEKYGIDEFEIFTSLEI